MQDKSYNLEEIYNRVEAVRIDKGFLSMSALDREVGAKNALGQYFRPAEKPKRNVVTLADKMSNRLGVNRDWLLTGSGPMYLKDITGRDEEALKYEKAGRMLDALLRELYGASCPICGAETKKPDEEPGL